MCENAIFHLKLPTKYEKSVFWCVINEQEHNNLSMNT